MRLTAEGYDYNEFSKQVSERLDLFMGGTQFPTPVVETIESDGLCGEEGCQMTIFNSEDICRSFPIKIDIDSFGNATVYPPFSEDLSDTYGLDEEIDEEGFIKRVIQEYIYTYIVMSKKEEIDLCH